MNAAERREQILRTGYEILGKKGLEGLHARTIAGEIGVNHAAVHHYFRRREDLLLGIAEYAGQRFGQDLERVQRDRPTATKRLEAHIALYEQYARPTSRYFRVMSSLFVAAPMVESLRGCLRSIVEEQGRRLRVDLDAARAEGGIRGESPFASSELLTSFLAGLCYRSQLAGGLDPTVPIDQVFASLFRV